MKKLFLLLIFEVFLSVFAISFISSTYWVPSTATWDGPNSNFSLVTFTAVGMYFNSTGTKMIILNNNKDIYQYTLSQAWNTSTATLDSSSNLSVSAQSGNPLGISFNSSGTKMYVLNGAVNNGTIYQYTLSQAWNTSTATWDGPGSNLSVGGQSGFPVTMTFNGTGNKMLLVDSSTNTIYQYNLSQAWNLSTATWDGPNSNFTTSPIVINLAGFFFKSTGDKMFLTTSLSPINIYQYTLSTPWQLNTSTWDGPTTNLSVNAQANNTAGLFFKSTGDKLYILGTAGTPSKVYQYTMLNAITFKISIFGTKNHIKIFGRSGFRLYL